MYIADIDFFTYTKLLVCLKHIFTRTKWEGGVLESVEKFSCWSMLSHFGSCLPLPLALCNYHNGHPVWSVISWKLAVGFSSNCQKLFLLTLGTKCTNFFKINCQDILSDFVDSLYYILHRYVTKFGLNVLEILRGR